MNENPSGVLRWKDVGRERPDPNTYTNSMKTHAVIFPFDLFGSAGTGAGAQLLGDALRELLEDTRGETQPTRSHVFRDQVRVREFVFETLDAWGDWRKTARQIVRQTWKQNEFLLYLAGNHLAVLPVYEELSENSLVIQLDAHLDIQNLSDCTTELSHGNFLLHASQPLPPIINVGHRDLFLPTEHIHAHYRTIFSAEEVIAEPDRVIAALVKATRGAKRIFLDIDCDVFDPAYFPATTHPLPFGPAPELVLRVVRAIGAKRLAGVAISEFCPARDRDDQSLNTLGWFVEWLLLQRYEESPRA